MQFVIQFQILLILACFFVGTCCTVYMLSCRCTTYAWKVADLVWVLLGGLGALVALLAGIHREDSSQLNRQIDVAYAITQEFERDAARFRLQYCEVDGQGPILRPHVLTLCEKVEFLSASTAGSRELPLFLEVAEVATPQLSLGSVFGGGVSQRNYDTMVGEVGRYRPELLAFDSEDEETMRAQEALQQSPAFLGISAEFQVIANTYKSLIEQLIELKAEWEFLQSNAQVLALQIIAICLVAFAAPFRVGKAVDDLK
ncbi:hypothetical protein [Cochlodiniinecator piscidefendens]|uniref:hypothetical protein n=1 Tax=Cochlodiniinecator piscidefendens TaxID=2715756 RepID=UPI00140D68FF|nr:hypothetical protein [Cochlodiniinecator piscidefendens]